MENRIGRLYEDENLIKILHAHPFRPEGGFIKDIWEIAGKMTGLAHQAL